MAVQTPDAPYSSWNEWDPEDYLDEYYAEVMSDEQYALEFLVEAMARVPAAPVALDFGCGPTVHHLFALTPKVRQIHLAEYLPSNCNAVRQWLAAAPGAHDWRPFTLETLRLEGNAQPTALEAEARERDVRRAVRDIYIADAGEIDPLGAEMRGFYPLVTTHYCAEGATNDKSTWRRYMRNITSLVKPGGTLILSACGAAESYCVGRYSFPCAGIDAGDILLSLRDNGFIDIDLRVRSVPGHADQGYSTVMFASGLKMAP